MALSTLFKSFRFGGSRTGRGSGPKKAPQSRPVVEALEQRELLCFSVTDLGGMGSPFTKVAGLNSLGQFTGGFRSRPGPPTAFLYSDGTIYELGNLPGGISNVGNDVNSFGQVVGVGISSISSTRAWIYRDGTMTDIGTLGGPNATARGINDAGQIVGESNSYADGPRHAFLYEGGVMTDLGTLGGVGTESWAEAINSWGQVVGYSSLVSGMRPFHAFLYSGGVMTDLGTLGGSDSEAYAINDQGQVAGTSINGEGRPHAFLYRDGVMTDLGTLPGSFTDSSASAINNYGEVVGGASYRMGPGVVSRAISYVGGVMYDLNDFIPPDSGWVLEYALDVNDSSQILGLGKLNGVAHHFKLDWQCWGNGPGPASDDGAGGLDTSVVAALSAPLGSAADFSLDVLLGHPGNAEPRSDLSEQAWARALAEDATQPAFESSSEAAADARVIDLAYADLSQALWLADGMPG